MSSNNVATFRAAHEEFNRREFDALLNRLSPTFSYRDHARGLTFDGREGFREFLSGWVTGFSDARVSEPTYLDAGNVVIAQFQARGTHDGAMGTLPATGRQLDLPMCEMIQFGDQGEIVGGGLYYDQLSILTQLGAAQIPTAAGRVGQQPPRNAIPMTVAADPPASVGRAHPRTDRARRW
jgi:steroid delta-isomerase-like uncharacterized protein